MGQDADRRGSFRNADLVFETRRTARLQLHERAAYADFQVWLAI